MNLLVGPGVPELELVVTALGGPNFNLLWVSSANIVCEKSRTWPNAPCRVEHKISRQTMHPPSPSNTAICACRRSVTEARRASFGCAATKSSRAGCLCTSYTPHHLRCATLAQVVPDVSPGFNVPQFYAQFVEQRKAEVSERVALVQSARGKSPKTAVPR